MCLSRANVLQDGQASGGEAAVMLMTEDGKSKQKKRTTSVVNLRENAKLSKKGVAVVGAARLRVSTPVIANTPR